MIAKFTIALTIFVAAYGNGILNGYAPLKDARVREHQQSKTDHGNYTFAYESKDNISTNNFNSDVSGGYGNKKTSYTTIYINGRTRKVEYIADKLGFRGIIKTNNPRTSGSTAVSAPLVAAAPVDYKTVLGDDASFHYGSGLGYGSGYIHGTDYGKGIGYGYGAHYGYGTGVGKVLGYAYRRRY